MDVEETKKVKSRVLHQILGMQEVARLDVVWVFGGGDGEDENGCVRER